MMVKNRQTNYKITTSKLDSKENPVQCARYQIKLN